LAQGALETARRTRVEVEREIARLQRNRRSGVQPDESPRELAAVAVPAEPEEAAPEAPTNVRPFKAPDQDEARPA
jgi:hypothetical protein